jgi:hypothetical protein
LEPAIAGLAAAALTLFDLDRTFYIPSGPSLRLQRLVWWWGFVVLNGSLAAGLYGVLADSDVLKGVNSTVRAAAIGIGYLGLVHLKFTTFSLGGKDVPFGFDALYEAARAFFYKRLNRIAKVARRDETMAKAQVTQLPALITEANLAVDQDSLMSTAEKTTAKAWIVAVAADDGASDLDRRVALANFILSGQFGG